jgi:valyl-tRNA synthetase
LDKYELGIAISNLYDFIWDVYCDWYIELAKPRLQSDEPKDVQNVLFWCLERILKLLHPFMPYVTEEIWSHLNDSLIVLESYPEYDESLNFPEEELLFNKVIDGIKVIRAKRSEMNVPPSVKAKLFAEVNDTKTAKIFSASESFFKKLAFASEVTVTDHFDDASGMVTAVTSDARFFIPFGELVDREKELTRLNKERLKVQKDIDFSSGKLSNPGFTSKAPAAQIEAEKQKLAAANDKMSKIKASISSLT